MLQKLTEPPYPVFPPPQPGPQPRQVHPPMVYVYERQAWEYKVVAKDTSVEPPLSEQELNALGGRGWELTGVAVSSGRLHYYFKRNRN
jgi:hypothetical protein